MVEWAVERVVTGETAVVVVVAVTTAAVVKEVVLARAVDWAVAVAKAECHRPWPYGGKYS